MQTRAARVFVCHAKSDIEATSEIVDLLEIALELPSGALSSSSLPGYSSDARSDHELAEMLRGSSVVLALVTEQSAKDETFGFELGAAWAYGIRIVPLLTGNASVNDLPWPLRSLAFVRPHDRAAWLGFVEELAQQLGVRARVASAANVALDDVAARASVSARPPADTSSVRESPLAFSTDGESAPLRPATTGSVLRQNPEQPSAFGAPSSRQLTERWLPESSDQLIAPVSGSGAGAVGLSRMLAFEAGRAMSDCVWNRDEHLDFARELAPQFGRFIDAMGGSWHDLSKLQDFDVWLGMTDNLLQALGPTQRDIAEWYELGYELSTLHSVASHSDGASPEEQREQEDVWRETLERLLARAEAVHIRYEDLARVLSLLENLIGPASSRDFTNISRSLEELRAHAANADRVASAA